jgi:L-iditol 2-dehydrogenase
MHAQVAKLAGATTVIVSEPVEFRRDMARKFGADITVDPTSEDLKAVVNEATGGQGVDAVIICIGVPELVNEALQHARNHGKVSLFAGFPADRSAPIDANLIHYKELSVYGSSNSTIVDYERAIELIESGGVDTAQLVTHRFPLSQFTKAVDMINDPEALKVAMIPTLG